MPIINNPEILRYGCLSKGVCTKLGTMMSDCKLSPWDDQAEGFGVDTNLSYSVIQFFKIKKKEVRANFKNAPNGKNKNK